MTVHLHKESENIRIKRGVRQGDTISPKLFTATLESIFRMLNWQNRGEKIQGEFHTNLRFADGIFLCTETPQYVQHNMYSYFNIICDMYNQKQPCHLPEETGVQLMCAASYDIWYRDLDTDQTSTEQTCGHTDQNGNKYAQHHIQG